MNNFQIVFRNTFFLTASEIFIKAVGFLWVIFLAHSLSVELYGRYNFVNSFIALFSFLPDLGVGLIVIREIAKDKEKAHIYLGNSLLLNGTLAIGMVFLVFLSVLFLSYSPEAEKLIFIASLTLLASTIRSVGIYYFDGTEKMHFSAFLNSANTFLLIIGGVIGLSGGYGLLGVFIGMLVGTILSTFVTWGIVLAKFTKPLVVFNGLITKKILKDGIPLGLAAFSALVYSKVDTVLIGQLLGEREVGIYSSASPFPFTAIQILNVPFMVAVFPALSRLSEVDHERFKKAILKSLLPILLWSVPLTLLLFVLSPLLIPFIFGSRYNEAIPVLQTLILFVPFASLSALLYKVLIVINKQMYFLLISILGAVLNVILNLLLIPNMGVMGAATSSVITQLILFLIYAGVVRYFVQSRTKYAEK